MSQSPDPSPGDAPASRQPPHDPPGQTAAAAGPASTDAAPRREPERDKANRSERTVVVERRSGFFARWLKRLAALLLFLLLIVAILLIGVTLVLRSDVPRSIGQSVASNLLGLDVGLGEVDVGWGGDVTIRDLLVRLPDAEGDGEKLLEVPRVHAELGALPLVALNYLRGGDPEVRRLEVESPTVYITETEAGWNVTRAISLVTARPGGPAEPAHTGPPRLPPLPEISVSDGKVIVRNLAGEEATVREVRLKGWRPSPLIYQVEGGMAESVLVNGQLLPASGIRQELALSVDNLPGLLAPVVTLPDAALSATWRGGLTADGVSGVVTLTRAGIQQITASGELAVTTAGGVLMVAPRELSILNLPGEANAARILEGSLLVRGGQAVEMSGLLIELLRVPPPVEGATASAQETQPAVPEGPEPRGRILLESAHVDLASLSAGLAVRFEQLQPGGNLNLSGGATASAGYDAFGRPQAQLALDAYGNVGPTGFQQVQAEVSASGPDYHDWRTLDVTLRLPQSAIVLGATQESTLIPKLTTTVLLRLADPQRPRIELGELRSLEPELVRLQGGGAYFTKANPEWEAGQYWLWLEQSGYPITLPRLGQQMPLDLGFVVRGQYNPSDGTIAPVEITNLYGSLADVYINGKGWYIVAKPEDEGGVPSPPLWLSLVITREARIPAPVTPPGREIIAAEQALERPLRDAVPGLIRSDAERDQQRLTQIVRAEVEPLRGMVTTWLNVGGDPVAMEFNGSGGLLTSDFAFGKYELGTIEALIDLTLSAERLTVHTVSDDEDQDQFARLFGAHVELQADIPLEPTLPGSIWLRVDDLLLSRLGAALALPEVTGELNADLFVILSGLDARQATIQEGTVTIEGLGTSQGQLAERISIQPRLNNGVLDVPVEAMQTALSAPGPTRLGEERTLAMNLRYELDRPTRLAITNLEAEGYPVVMPARQPDGRYILAELSVRSAQLTFELADTGPIVHGDTTAGADVWIGDRPFELEKLVESALEASATRTQVSLDRLAADLIGIGELRGGGMLELRDLPGASKIWIHGRELDLSALAARLRVPEGATGVANFAVSVEPAPGERPRGEVLVNFGFQGYGASWRSVSLDSGQVIAYLSRMPRPDDSPQRGQFDFTILTTERAHLQLAGGTIDFYGKLRNRGTGAGVSPLQPLATNVLASLLGGGDEWYVNGSLDIVDLNLAELGPLLDQPDIDGRFGASLVAYGNLNQPPRFPGAQEDLPPIPINGEGSAYIRDGRLRRFNLFQQILELVNVVPNPRRDELEARFRLETGNFYMDSVRAFVDGTEIRFSGQLDNVFERELTTIDATGVVFWRPLSQIPLPFFREADEIFAALQSQLTTFHATGPLKQPRVVPATASDVGQTLRALLAGEGKKRGSKR